MAISPQEEAGRALEALSRDLILLIKSARVYPNGHPLLDRILERLNTWTLPDGRSEISLGVTRTELILDGKFFGDKNNRTGELARILNGRKIKELSIVGTPSVFELTRFCQLLSDLTVADGQEISERLPAEGINSIKIRPLDINLLHESLSLGEKSKSQDAEELGQKAWLWLIAENSEPEDIAKALDSDDLWRSAEMSQEGAFSLGYIISGLGMRLEQGLGFLDAEAKKGVLSRLSAIGSRVSPKELAAMMANCPDPMLLQKDGMLALLGDIEGEDLIDLMVQVVSEEGPFSQRASMIAKVVSPEQRHDMLDNVRTRLKKGNHREYVADVWLNLQNLLLDVFDEEFVDESYQKTLNAFSQGGEKRTYSLDMDFSQPADANLDMIYLGMALSVGGLMEGPWDNLFERIRARSKDGDPAEILNILLAIENVSPHVFGFRQDFLPQVVETVINRARVVGPRERMGFVRFVNRYRDDVFDMLMRHLKDQNRLSVRKFLVEVVSGLSNDMTPKLVAAGRAGPWFFTRNILIALGRRKDMLSFPYVASELNNADGRVVREALRALSKFEEKGLAEIKRFRDDKARDEFKTLAQALVLRLEGAA